MKKNIFKITIKVYTNSNQTKKIQYVIVKLQIFSVREIKLKLNFQDFLIAFLAFTGVQSHGQMPVLHSNLINNFQFSLFLIKIEYI